MLYSDEPRWILLRVTEAQQVKTPVQATPQCYPAPSVRTCHWTMSDSSFAFPWAILERALKSRHACSESGFWFFLWVWLGSDRTSVVQGQTYPGSSSDLWTCKDENENRAMKSPKSAATYTHTHTHTHPPKGPICPANCPHFNISLQLTFSHFSLINSK